MNSEIFFDDIDEFEDIPEEINAAEDAISKLSIAIFGESSTPNGSGVVINDNGIFISAGHIFKNEKDKFKAWLNDQIFEIEILYKEYDNEKSDFLIGKLKDFQSIRFCELPIIKDCGNLLIGNTVYVTGYKRKRIITTDLLRRINIEKEFDLLKQRQESEVFGTNQTEKDIPIILQWNCLTWRKFTYHGKEDMKFMGFSGAPVYNKDELYGIVLSNYFLKSDYIMTKLDEFKIDYRR